MRPLVILFRTLRAIGIAAVLVGSVYAIVEPEPLVLPAVAPPLLFLQVPDPNHEGHKMRADGATCKPSGADACHCTVRYCNTDESGNVSDYDMSSSCQWFCQKDQCTCHTCLDKCPDGPDLR